MAEVVAGNDVLPAEDAVLQQNTAVSAAALGKRHRAGIDAHDAPHLPQRWKMRVPVKQHISSAHGGKIVGVIDMSVGGENPAPVGGNPGIVRQNRKLQDHLVDLRVAVSPDAQDPVLHPVEEAAAPDESKTEEEPKPEEESDGKAAAAAAAVAAAAAGTVLASKDERIGSGAGPRTPSKKPEKGQGNSRPAVSYQTGSKKPNPSSRKKKKKSYRGVLALLLLCALLVLAAIILHAVTKHSQEPVNPTPTAVPSATQPAETDVVPEPPETSEVEPSEAPETAMTVFKEDSSWTAAESKCESQGGHLAVIHNQEELQEVISLAKQQGIRFIWIGCQRMSDGALHWVNGDAIDYYVWADGEPSLIGSGGESENYIMLWNTREDLTGEWVYNDVGNNPAMEYASTYSGRMGYILQTGN